MGDRLKQRKGYLFSVVSAVRFLPQNVDAGSWRGFKNAWTKRLGWGGEKQLMGLKK